MFHINCQIPRCVLTWVSVVVAFCYDVLYEPCDGFSDSLPVMLHCGVCFLIFLFLAFSYFCGLDLSDYVWEFKVTVLPLWLLL